MKDLAIFPRLLEVEVFPHMISENRTWQGRSRHSGRCATCPLARAINKALCIGDEEQPYALVSGAVEIVGYPGGKAIARYGLPDGAIKFIGAADADNRGEKPLMGRQFEPGKFVLTRMD